MISVALGSCSKVPVNAPIPITILRSLEQFPFHRYLDSSFALARDTIYLTITPVSLLDPNIPHAEVPGQAEIAYAFRTSAPAAVTSLALLLPASGYSHTVTLWDSATGEVLAQTNVPSLDSGHWTSVSLAITNQAVPIQPGKGYIVGYNTLAIGGTIDTYSPGNALYLLYGIYDFSQGPDKSSFRPIMPFTEGLISFEGIWQNAYDRPLRMSSPGATPAASYVNGVPGVIDIGYIAAP
jgi:hypothetical protein